MNKHKSKSEIEKLYNEKLKEKYQKKEDFNKQNTGITLIALVVTIIVLLILAGVTISMLLGEDGIIQTAQEAKNTWEGAIANEQQEIQNLVNELNTIMNEQGGTGETPETDTEKPIPADGSFNKEKGVNTPDLQDGALTPIKWQDNGNGSYTMIETKPDDPEWYSYTTADKKWANAITKDGSMWVWVPRYAYQISTNYHTNSETGGNINIEFLQGTTNVGATGKTIVEYNEATTNSFTKFPNGYVVHPGFEYSSTAEGLWVAKFEASRNNATSTSIGSGTTLKIQPGVQSWRSITVNDIYMTCLNYDSNTLGSANLNSHMMKNTEWGACAYLAQSNYGKNAEVWINPNTTTGQVGSSVSASGTASTSAYNTENGPQASTTGNTYGIYDMSGGAWEYVAAYVTNDNANLNNYGASLVSGAAYTKDIYTSSGDTPQGNYNANVSKYGDAIYETSNNYSNTNGSWYVDYSNFIFSTSPFFCRGGYNGSKSSAGLFCFLGHVGIADSICGFRPVLVAF